MTVGDTSEASRQDFTRNNERMVVGYTTQLGIRDK